MPWYKSGTVSCAQNSTTVTGTSTAFAANARVGDAFLGPDGRWYEVVNIPSDTVLSILPAYLGASTSTGAYALAPMQGYVKDSADTLRTLVNKFGSLAAAPSINALANLTGSQGKFPYFTAADQMALASLSDYAKSGQNGDIKTLTGLTTALSADQGGTGVKSLADLLTALNSLGNFSRSNILGTVSQSSGTPTGAIIERGSNANGEYIKFFDGTMWCKGAVSTSVTANGVSQYPYTLPAAFINTDFFAAAFVQPQSSGDFYGAVYKVNQTTQRVDFGFRNGATAQNITGHYIAIGRWF